MSDLKGQFEKAAQEVQSLPKKPDNDTLLRLYALYKQATAGDAGGKRPGFTDPVGRAKYDAWEKIKGLSKDQAMQQYIDLADKLIG
jgi:diazepam-binding inhibitor (GABA receptor modulating acyl-CoA-binding protein)